MKSGYIYIYIFQDLNSADANTIGSIAGFASIDWGAAIQVMTATTSMPIVIIGTDNALKAGYCAKYFDCLFAVVYMWPSSSLTSLYVVLEHDFLRDCKIFTLHLISYMLYRILSLRNQAHSYCGLGIGIASQLVSTSHDHMYYPCGRAL